MLDNYTIDKEYDNSSAGLPGFLLQADFRMAFLLVQFEVSYPGKSLPTKSTAVWFFPSVNSLMFLQVASFWEHLPTCGAMERPLSCVDALMDLHFFGPVESFATVATNKQPFLATSPVVNCAMVTDGQMRGKNGATTYIALSPTVNIGSRWEISCCYWVWTWWPPFSHCNCQSIIKKLFDHRVGVYIVGKCFKLWVTAAVINILVLVYCFLPF